MSSVAETERPIYGVLLDPSISGGMEIPITLHTGSILSLLMDAYEYDGTLKIISRTVDDDQTAESIMSDDLVDTLVGWRGLARQEFFKHIKERMPQQAFSYHSIHIRAHQGGQQEFRTEWLNLTQAAQDYEANELRVRDLLPRIGGISLLELDVIGDNPMAIIQKVRLNVFDRQFGLRGSAIDASLFDIHTLSNDLYHDYLAANL